MALTCSIKVRGDIGGKAFRAVEVTCDGSTTTVDAADIELTWIDSAIITPRAELSASQTKDWAALTDGDSDDQDVTVTGAALGDFAEACLSLDVADLTLTGAVSAANTVTVVLSNSTGDSTINLASTDLRVRVLKDMGLSTLRGSYIIFYPALQSGDVFTLWAIGF